MAVAKSSMNIATPNSTAAAVIMWSSIDSAANNVYFDVNGKDVSQIIFLIANSNSTDVGTTAGLFYFGASDSDDAGTSSGNFPYSARRLGRKAVSAQPPTTDGKEALSPSTTAAKVAISVAGPFEAARLKDTDGYIQVSKRKASSDTGRTYIAAISIPSS
jgi:hypothetical protein